MSQREVNAITGRLSLRPPQSESLAKLASAIEASPAMLRRPPAFPKQLSDRWKVHGCLNHAPP